MVAFATEYEPETATVEPEKPPAREASACQDRARVFFWQVPDCAGLTGSATRTVAGENDRFSYDACRGVSLAHGEQGWAFPCDEIRALLDAYYQGYSNPTDAEIVALAAREAAVESDPWTSSSSIRDSIQPMDAFFAMVVSTSPFETSSWRQSVSTHGSAWESAPLITSILTGGNILTVKRYDDPLRGNAIAVTHWTDSFQHVKDAAVFHMQQWGIVSGSVNLDISLKYLENAYNVNCN